MSKSHRLAWAAGFLDGDGFITIPNRTTKVNDKVYGSSYIRIGACQANRLPLIELQSLFKGTIRVKNSGPNKEGYNRKEQWIWQCSTNQAKDALIQLLPYLIHKREAAEIAIEFQNTMGTTKKTSDEIKTYRKLLQQKLKDINSLD